MSRFALFLLCLMPVPAAMWYATQSFAAKIEYDTAFLGEPIIGTLYAPWDIIIWYKKYQEYVPEFFYGPTFVIFFGFAAMLLLMFLAKPTETYESHGTAHWADYKEILKMDLISAHGVVIGLYDSPFKKSLTAILRSLENRKKEVVSFAEMDFDKIQAKKTDKLLNQLGQIEDELSGMESDDPKYKDLEKQKKDAEEQLENLPKYDVKKNNYFKYLWYVKPYKVFYSFYVKLSHFYLRDNSNKHLAVIAPTRSGKGVGLIVPTLLGGWTESCIVNDIKSENWGITSGYRKLMGQKVIKFEPTADDGSSARWNPLDEIRIGDPTEVSMAQNLASIIADYEGKGKPDHWTANAGNVIMACLLHLKYAHFAEPTKYPHPPNLYSVAAFLKGEAELDDDGQLKAEEFKEKLNKLLKYDHVPKDGLRVKEWNTKNARYEEKIFTTEELLAMYPDAKANAGGGYSHPIIAQAFSEIASKPDNELGSIVSTANTALKEYLDPVLSMNTSVSDFCIDDLMNYSKPVSLYLVTPPSDLLRLAPIFRLFFEMMVRHHARKIGDYENGQAKTVYKHKCLFLMDEFSSLGNLQSFAATLSYIAGYGMKVFLINQGLPQINGIYGKDNQILMNCHLQIFYAPNDNDTGQYAEKLLGNKTITVESISDSGGFSLKKNYSHSQTGRALMTADELKRLGDQEIIVASGSAPVLTDKIKYYENHFFMDKLRDAPIVSDVIRDKDAKGEPYPENINPKREALIESKKKEKQAKNAKKQNAPKVAPQDFSLGEVEDFINKGDNSNEEKEINDDGSEYFADGGNYSEEE